MRLSDNGRRLIQGFEGLSLRAYPDADGYSIGYGHFLGKDPGLASRTITQDEAERLFDQDVARFELGVSTTTPRSAQHEFDAMVSLAYNIGTGGFASSTVAKRHNLGDREGAADAFLMWNKSQGAVHPGLVKRREKERSVYLHGHSPGALFPAPAPPMTPAAPSGGGWATVDKGGVSSPVTPAVAPIVGLLAALGWIVLRLAQR